MILTAAQMVDAERAAFAAGESAESLMEIAGRRLAEFVEQFHFNESTRVACPFCSPERKKANSKDMTLTRKNDGAVVYHCHHCYANGSVQPKKDFKLSAVPSTTVISNKLQGEHYAWLQSRGISPATADKMKVFAADKFFKLASIAPLTSEPIATPGFATKS